MRKFKTGSLVTLKSDFEKNCRGYVLDDNGQANYQNRADCDLNGKEVKILARQDDELAVEYNNMLFFILADKVAPQP